MIDGVLAAIDKTRVVAVIRRLGPSEVRGVARALSGAGITCIEVTADSPGAFGSIELLAGEFPDVIPGAGTVLTASQAQEAARRGARFIVSPNVEPEVVKAAVEAGTVAIPGAMTPTEIVNALKAGAHLVKVFPASVVGLNFFRELRGPFPEVKTVATGGIAPESVGDYLKSGAYAVGIGSSLVPKEAVAAKRFDLIEAIARTVASNVRSVLAG